MDAATPAGSNPQETQAVGQSQNFHAIHPSIAPSVSEKGNLSMAGLYTALQHRLDAVPLADFATALWMTAAYALLAFPSAPRQPTIGTIFKCVLAKAQAGSRARLTG